MSCGHFSKSHLITATLNDFSNRKMSHVLQRFSLAQQIFAVSSNRLRCQLFRYCIEDPIAIGRILILKYECNGRDTARRRASMRALQDSRYYRYIRAEQSGRAFCVRGPTRLLDALDIRKKQINITSCF